MEPGDDSDDARGAPDVPVHAEELVVQRRLNSRAGPDVPAGAEDPV